ncbi:hypothetical protein [Cyclobacterium lianum]|uniref:hypothetical protein n=1 Tax=Cyclobacterium lianum TaxID=388280 RepID=UPI0009333A0C|nr:hypothetical protein [Cyclobacterium lianum]
MGGAWKSFGNFFAGAYRFDFNGLEGGDQVNGHGSSYTTEFRQYDPGIGRTWSRELQLKPEQIMLFHEYLSQVRPKLLKGNERETLLIGSRQHPVIAEDIIKQVTRRVKGL